MWAAAAMAGGRGFVVAVWSAPHTCGSWLYQLRLDDRGAVAGFTPLRMPEIDGYVFAVAVTPDGATIGYTDELCQDSPSSNVVAVADTATGTSRQWLAPKQENIDSLSLSADGRRLAYSGGGGNYPWSAGLLRTGSAAGQLAAPGQIVVRGARLTPPSTIPASVIAADGRSLYFCTGSPAFSAIGSRLYQVNIARGTQRAWHRFTGGRLCGVSLDSSGRFLLVSSTTGFSSMRVAVLDTVTGRIRQLPAVGLASGQSAGSVVPTW